MTPKPNSADINADIKKDDYKFGFSDPEQFVFKSQKGLTKEIVIEISKMKKEPQWMLDFRLRSLEIFFKKDSIALLFTSSSENKSISSDNLCWK